MMALAIWATELLLAAVPTNANSVGRGERLARSPVLLFHCIHFIILELDLSFLYLCIFILEDQPIPSGITDS